MYKDILLPIDLGQTSSWEKALPAALALCRHLDANLHIMTVVPDHSFHYVSQYFPAGYEQKLLETATDDLNAFVEEHVPKDVNLQRIVVHGSIYREIVKTAQDIGADLVVMASHTPEASDFLIGPNAEKVLRHFERSVLIVRE
jgi:nucleotide-binding universal stress UspA family protein